MLRIFDVFFIVINNKFVSKEIEKNKKENYFLIEIKKMLQFANLKTSNFLKAIKYVIIQYFLKSYNQNE